MKTKKKLYKIKNIICSIYLCYYIRLNIKERSIFENSIDDLIDKKEFKNDLRKGFSDILKEEEEFLLDKIELNKNLNKNSILLLKEMIFLSFISIVTQIPLFIIGESGIGKSLSIEIIINSMKGKYSKNKFFQNFPKVKPLYFQVSKFTNQEDIQKIFNEEKNIKNDESTISLIIFDRMELSTKKLNNYDEIFDLLNLKYFDEKKENISFIGISNCLLKNINLNKGLILSVANLEKKFDDLYYLCQNIVMDISEDLCKHEIFKIICNTYWDYKRTLKLIEDLMKFKKLKLESKEQINFSNSNFNDFKSQNFKELKKINVNFQKNFHGLRDLFSLIKELAIEMNKLGTQDDEGEIVSLVEKYIERNFGGIYYEIDIDFNNNFVDLESEMKKIRDISNRINYKKEFQKISSIFLFKNLFNYIINKDLYEDNSSDYLAIKDYEININNLNQYNIPKCINDYINNNSNTRILLIEINPEFSLLLYKYLKINNPDKNIVFYEESPFNGDNNFEYMLNIIYKIKEALKNNKLIIFHNINIIQPYLYALCDNHLNDFNKILMPINSKIIIMEDENSINKIDKALLNRFEKIKIFSLVELLNKEQFMIYRKILEEINFDYISNQIKKKNENLNSIILNFKDKYIEGLIFNSYMKLLNNNEVTNEEKIKEEIYYKIGKILPLEIINFLPNNHVIKSAFNKIKRYHNLDDYLLNNENNNYKISVIYTFDNLVEIIKDNYDNIKFYVSDIKNENNLKNLVEEIIFKNENMKGINNYNVIINVDQNNLYKIQFIINIINNYYTKGNFEKYKFIFLINIKSCYYEKDDLKYYPLFDINENIEQLFIEKYEGNKINSDDLEDENNMEIENEEIESDNLEFENDY